MAEADIQNRSDFNATSYFGRKPDKPKTCTIAMKIEDIADKMQRFDHDEFLESEVIEYCDMKFFLRLYPNDKYAGHFRTHLTVLNPKNIKWNQVQVLIGESSAGGFLKTLSVFPEKVEDNLKYRFGVQDWLPHRPVLEDENVTHFPGGVLTVKAVISIRGEETVIHTSSKLPEKSVTPAQITKKMAGDFKNMMENQSFSDFRIVCQGEVIPCHRNVLSARSEIFEAMLEHNMRESETGEVQINDFDPKTMKAVILYMYTGEIKYSQGNVEHLLKTADKYRLDQLKNAIEDVLIQDIKVENAIDMFVLGDTVQADRLRDSSKDIIVRNALAIVKMDGWKEALGKFQDLTLEILESVVNSKSVA